MKLLRPILVAGLLATGTLAAMPAAAQMRPLSDPVVAHPDPESLFSSKDKKLHRNKQASLHIMKELLQCNQWKRAGEWLTDRYIQHNPFAASGLEGVIHYFVDIAKRQPTPTCDKLTSPVVAVQAEGDYVTVLTVRKLPVPGGKEGETYTTTWFDTWRFVDGKADEHWDPAALPEVPPPAPAAGGMAMNREMMAEHQKMMQRAKDREQIEALMWHYDRALDSYNADAYAASFTPDGAFGQVKGREALHKMIADLKAGQEERRKQGISIGTMRHFTMNQYLEFIDDNHARYHYYHQTVFGTGGRIGQSDAPVVAAAGNGVDDLVKVDGKWLIQNRNVAAADDF